MGELVVMVRGLVIWLLFMKNKFKVWLFFVGWRVVLFRFSVRVKFLLVLK